MGCVLCTLMGCVPSRTLVGCDPCHLIIIRACGVYACVAVVFLYAYGVYACGVCSCTLMGYMPVGCVLVRLWGICLWGVFLYAYGVYACGVCSCTLMGYMPVGCVLVRLWGICLWGVFLYAYGVYACSCTLMGCVPYAPVGCYMPLTPQTYLCSCTLMGYRCVPYTRLWGVFLYAYGVCPFYAPVGCVLVRLWGVSLIRACGVCSCTLMG